jgi:hypothetical protein
VVPFKCPAQCCRPARTCSSSPTLTAAGAQIWEKDGSKLITTLLTIPDEQAEAKDEPVVMFTERPIGEAQAIKSWFYPGDRFGQEFIYPKDQAMKIARETNTSVLAYTGDMKSDADVAAMRGAEVGRVDGQAQDAAKQAADADRTAGTTAATADTTAPSTTASSTAAAAPSPAETAAPSTTTSARTASGTAAVAPSPSANRTESPAPSAVGTTDRPLGRPAGGAVGGAERHGPGGQR